MVLAWPHERVDPLRGFAAYGGGFNVLNTHYVASLAWTGFWGVVLAASVVVLSLLYAIARFGMWLCIRHQVKVREARAHSSSAWRRRAWLSNTRCGAQVLSGIRPCCCTAKRGTYGRRIA